MDFDELIGQTVDFYGVDCNALCVRSDDMEERLAFEAVEDECDGYRSCMRELNQIPAEGKIFFREPVAKLTVERDEELSGHRLVDESGHVWLRMGTSRWDDWYPCFTFDYDPPRNVT